jgi:CO/xanthine dehydrogenase FAD-binding subunit
MFLPFDYLAPKTLKECLKLISENENSNILAGGTDLVVNIRSGKIKPQLVIDIKNISELKNITKSDNYIEISPLATMNQIAKMPLLQNQYSLLSYAASIMGCYEIRNRATIGGNIINASPGAETLNPLVVLGAKVVLESISGERILSVEEFVSGPNKTEIQKNELLTKILIPILNEETDGIYMRRQRVKGMDLASVNCAILVTNKNNISKRKIKISFGTVAPKPYRPTKVEQLLENNKITKNLLKECVNIINSEINPRATSLRASPEYKKFMVEYFLTEGLTKVLGVEIK